ncbi:unnamed protein product [Anisakis simplex]|uniref:DDE_Tnp_1_7 domain-containing protein n=1 Tax=Anisakis simplex TaxID=6269 RepID=A0A0M3JZ07_ANISI|nr:unnamed protein product [Anisakis simplex]
MDGRFGAKRARTEEDPRLAPFGEFLRARGAEGIPCATLLQALTVLQIIPTDCRFSDYCWATWQVMARYAGPLSGHRIREMERTGVIPDGVVDAFCRLNEVVLVVHPLYSGTPLKIFGKPGKPVKEIAECLGTYAALNIQAATTENIQKKTPLPAITEEEEEEEPQPGPSSRPDFPAGPATNIDLITPDDGTNNLNDISTQLTDTTVTSSPTSPITSSPSSSSSHSPSPPTNRYNFRHPRREASPITLRINPQFKAANTSTLTAQHAAELATTIPTPYKLINNKIANCRAAPGALPPLLRWPPGKFTTLHMVWAHRDRAPRPLGAADNNIYGLTPRREVCCSAKEGRGEEDGHRRATPGARPRFIIYRGPRGNLGGRG